jgi:hypothetical protein
MPAYEENDQDRHHNDNDTYCDCVHLHQTGKAIELKLNIKVRVVLAFLIAFISLAVTSVFGILGGNVAGTAPVGAMLDRAAKQVGSSTERSRVSQLAA